MATNQIAQKLQDMQRQMEQDVAEIKKIESEFTKVAQAKQTLIEKKSENEMVLSEFNLLSASASVYKLVGPVLAKQDIGESKANVQKRIEFIQKEIIRMDQLETDFQSKVEDRKKNIMKANDEYRKIVSQAQAQQPQKAQ